MTESEMDRRVEAAVNAYDLARQSAHGRPCPPMSKANRAFIRPLIAAAVAAADAVLRSEASGSSSAGEPDFRRLK